MIPSHTTRKLERATAEKILKSFHNHRIVLRDEITGGRSGAPVWLARIEGPHFNGFVYAKFDTPERCAQQLEKHQLARTEALMPFIPAILKPEASAAVLGPVEDWSAVLYEAAQGTIYEAASLAKLIGDDRCAPKDIAAQITRLVDEALSVWYGNRPIEGDDLSIPDLITKLMTVGGEAKTIGIEERLKGYGFTGREHRKLNFLMHDVTTPNPVAYIAQRDLWRKRNPQPAQLPFFVLSTPQVPAHGDLHAENIICALENGSPASGRPPQLIDFVLHERQRVLSQKANGKGKRVSED